MRRFVHAAASVLPLSMSTWRVRANRYIREHAAELLPTVVRSTTFQLPNWTSIRLKRLFKLAALMLTTVWFAMLLYDGLWMTRALHSTTPGGVKLFAMRFEPVAPVHQTALTTLADIDGFECVAWRATTDCVSEGEMEDKPCSFVVTETDSGYCEYRHRETGARRAFMVSSCNSPASKLGLTCENATAFTRYNLLALEYQPSKQLSIAKCRQDFVRENTAVATEMFKLRGGAIDVAAGANAGAGAAALRKRVTSVVADGAWFSGAVFDRGIAIMIYDAMLLSVYAQVRSLRAMGCILPIELWYVPREINPSESKLVQSLLTDFGAYLRVVDDPAATHYFSKAYAVAYSAFDNVLFMDADNFAARDPTYLFDTPEFTSTGALFWPDYWRPNHTTFDVNEQSFVWELLGIDYVDMFEQESGQILIDRTRHMRALRALLHYALTSPNLIQDLKLLWGDKDLFRMAWMRTQSSFHMIQRPPGSAGVTAIEIQEQSGTIMGETDSEPSLPAESKVVFCGVTMVQHDPEGEIVFMHCNGRKLVHNDVNQIWTHIVQFREGISIEHYIIGLVVRLNQFPLVNACWGHHHDFEPWYSLRPIADFPFAGIEQQLIGFVAQAEALERGGDVV
jgi:alpha 1,2-mannosyltransferase